MSMEIATTLIAIGALLLLGMLADEIGHRTQMPRVTLLILCGLAAGPAFLDLLPENLTQLYETLAVLALSMVAFVLGGKLSRVHLQNSGKAVTVVSASAVVSTAIVVFAGLALLGFPLELALILAALATAHRPGGHQRCHPPVPRQGALHNHPVRHRCAGRYLGHSGLCVLSHGSTALMGGDGSGALLHAVWEIAGSLLLGAIVGSRQATCQAASNPATRPLPRRLASCS